MRRVALLLLLLLATLVLSEVAVRIVGAVRGTRYAIDLQPQVNIGELLFQPHPYVGYVQRPGATSREGNMLSFRINSLGYRGPEFTEAKPAGQLRIACLGGSTVWGVGASGDDSTWPAQLQRILEQALPQGGPWTGVLVVNAGVSGYTLIDSFLELKLRLLNLQPDLVIVYHGVNDARVVDGGRFKSDYTQSRRPWSIPVPSATDVVLGWSHLYGLLSDRSGERLDLFDLVQEPDDQVGATPGDWDLGVENFALTLRQTIAVSRVSGADTLLTSFAYTRRRPVKQQWMREQVFTLMDRFSNASRTVAAEQQVPFVDLQAAVGEDAALFVDPIHLSDAGNLVIARAIAAELLRDGALWKRRPEGRRASR